jgi:hypothetical protein
MYGFRKVDGAKGEYVFEHEHFIQGRKENLKLIVRKVSSSKAAAAGAASVAGASASAAAVTPSISEAVGIGGVLEGVNSSIESKIDLLLANQRDILVRLESLERQHSLGSAVPPNGDDCLHCDRISSVFSGFGNLSPSQNTDSINFLE